MDTTESRSEMPSLEVLARVHCRRNSKRLEAVLTMAQEGFPTGIMADLAERLGVPRSTLEYWRDEFRKEVGIALKESGYQVPDSYLPAKAKARAA